tara:strand:- start:1911 stop:2978 length:1068 start_codon:yes stop_codon:yes gene_type:complete
MRRHLILSLAALTLSATAGAQQLYATDFTDLTGWTTSSFDDPNYGWAADATPSTFCAGAFRSAPASLNFNDGTNYGQPTGQPTGVIASGQARSPVIDLSLADTDPELKFWVGYHIEDEGCVFDALHLTIEPVGGAAPPLEICLTELTGLCNWFQVTLPLERTWGQVQIVFSFDTLDNELNGFPGVFIDDLEVAGSGTVLECSPANSHYQGGSVTLDFSDFNGSPGSGLHLIASNGPVGEFGFFFVGPGIGPALPVFQGIHCLSQPTGRYNSQVATNMGLPQLNSLGQFNNAGFFQNNSGTSTVGSGFDVPNELPFGPTPQFIAPGETWYFQLWYRDRTPGGAPSANFSDAFGANF